MRFEQSSIEYNAVKLRNEAVGLITFGLNGSCAIGALNVLETLKSVKTDEHFYFLIKKRKIKIKPQAEFSKGETVEH